MAPRYTEHERSILEEQLKRTPYPTPKQVDVLADQFGRTHASVAYWFRRKRRESIQTKHVKVDTYSKTIDTKQLQELRNQLHMAKSKDQKKKALTTKKYRKTKVNQRADDSVLDINPEKELQMLLIDDDTWHDGYVPMRESDDEDGHFMLGGIQWQQYWKEYALHCALHFSNCI